MIRLLLKTMRDKIDKEIFFYSNMFDRIRLSLRNIWSVHNPVRLNVSTCGIIPFSYFLSTYALFLMEKYMKMFQN